MHKVTLMLVAAGLFITSILVLLMFKGVHLKERLMVKWSQVQSPEKAGDQIAMFMFSIIEENPRISIEDGSEFSQRFFASFKRRGASQSPETEFALVPFKKKSPVFFHKNSRY